MNLHAIALEIVRDNGSPDPGVLAEALIARLKPRDYRAALDLMARDYMRHIVSNDRSNGGNGHAGGQGTAKVAGSAAAWKLLKMREFVPSTGSWMYLRDATRDQVLEMAELRYEKARENTVSGDRYMDLHEKMKAAGVLRAKDLEASVLLAVFGQDVAA